MIPPAAVCVAFFALAATSHSIPIEDRMAAADAGKAILRRAADIDATAEAAGYAVDYLAARPWLMTVVSQPCETMATEGSKE